jgi:hypothetical protein
MRKSRRALAILIVSSGLAAASRPPVVPEDSALRALAGTWRGTADVGVKWTTQRTLAVELTIDSLQRVRGRVGDAELTNGFLRSNAGLVGRAIGRKPGLIVEGYLKGPVIAAEEVRRGGVTIPLDQRDGQLVGALATSGSNNGIQEQMVLTAGPLVLQRK